MPTLPSLFTLALTRPPRPGGSGPLDPLRLRVRRRRLTRLTLGLLLAGLAAAAVGALTLPGDRWPPAGSPPAGPPSTAPVASPVTSSDSTTGRLGLGPGERAVALAPPTAQPPLVEGDRVDLVAVAMGPDGLVEARILDVPARVLALDPAGVTVAVPVDDVVAVLRHQGQGPIELVLRP